MNLIERSQNLMELLKRQKFIKENLTQIQNYQKRCDDLIKKRDDLLPIVRSYGILRQAQIVEGIQLPTRKDFLVFLRQTKNQFQSSPEWILDPQQFRIKQFNNGIDRISDQLNTHCSSAWKYYVKEHIPEISRDVLRVLGRVTGFQRFIEQLEDLQLRANRLEESLPRDQEEIDGILVLAKKIHLLWNEKIGGQGIPQEVLNFLKEACTNGASLDKYTFAVQEWLQRHQVMSSFRIKADGSSSYR